MPNPCVLLEVRSPGIIKGPPRPETAYFSFILLINKNECKQLWQTSILLNLTLYRWQISNLNIVLIKWPQIPDSARPYTKSLILHPKQWGCQAELRQNIRLLSLFFLLLKKSVALVSVVAPTAKGYIWNDKLKLLLRAVQTIQTLQDTGSCLRERLQKTSARFQAGAMLYKTYISSSLFLLLKKKCSVCSAQLDKAYKDSQRNMVPLSVRLGSRLQHRRSRTS